MRYQHNPDKWDNSALRTSFFFKLLLLFFTILYNPCYVYSDSVHSIHKEMSPENISSFVRSLISSGEYYRAHTELSRLNEYYPGYLSPFCYNITESYILYKSGRYDDILALNSETAGEEHQCGMNLFRIDSYLKSRERNYEKIPDGLLDSQCGIPFYSPFYAKRRDYYSILNSFSRDLDIPVMTDDEYKYSAEYAKEISMDKKSPAAGLISGIIPGMGYIYAGETGTGIVAMIVIAAGTAITWGAHVNDVEPLAAVSGAATFFMYSGSIAGGYMATARYNRELSKKLILRLDKDFMLDRDIDDIYIKCGIESDVR